MDLPSLQSPAEVLLHRRALRRDFRSWCLHALRDRGMVPAKHHDLLIATLQAVADGEVRNVIFLLPPGAAKSTYTSVLFPPWYLNRHPQNLILACSYSYSLIEGFGRQCRDIISSESVNLGYDLSKTAAAAGDWRISVSGRNAGGYFCAGVGSGIAGHRADLGFIDDYLGSQEDADSQLIRDKQWAWYWNDFWPRLKPQAAQVIVANRRHEDDLIGRLLEKKSNQWTVIRLPMLAEENDPLGRQPGERLWPEWFTEEQVQAARALPRVWAGLYQQRPSPEEGEFFKRQWFTPYRPDDLLAVEKSGLRYYVGADYAVSKGEENDRTCFLCVGVDSSDRIWILPDWYWERCNSFEAVEASISMAKRRKPIAWWLGKEVITKAIGPFLTKRMQETGIYIPTEGLSEAKDKQTKAQAIRARATQKMIMVPEYAPGWDLAFQEILTFPGGKHDDFVDALAKIGQGLALMTKPDKPASAPFTGLLPSPTLTMKYVRWSDRAKQRRLSFIDN